MCLYIVYELRLKDDKNFHISSRRNELTNCHPGNFAEVLPQYYCSWLLHLNILFHTTSLPDHLKNVYYDTVGSVLPVNYST